MNIKSGQGIILCVLAMLCIAGMDATGKLLVQNYPIVEIMTVRFAIFFLIVILVSGLTGQLKEIRSKAIGIQVIRSLLLVVEVTVFIIAFSMMPLADVHAIAALAPLFAILMAGWYLKEKVDRGSWVAVTIGFLGTLVIIRPGLGVMSWHTVIPISGAILWAAYQVLSRRVAQFDSSNTTVFYTALIGLMVFGGLAPFNWVEPTSAGWQLLILNGLLGAMGHYLLIKALAFAPASTLQPFSYTLLFWAVVIGFVIFGDLPDNLTLLGAIIVLGAGIYASDAGRTMGNPLRRIFKREKRSIRSTSNPAN
ncbi:DMT family transporter [Microbulbifer sp. THAF38]|uniref:DMT family transporter n=1 Tax=Microbulbifer sp. THAF38 TaxID=2587856 RepID=UPI0012682E86|nr:DMT family transporter [Microbulbifer sp. THAF38]QFT55372.1 Riboflavin transporter [Microbulbifer sp. THAF38]